jgi:hypothetical protein
MAEELEVTWPDSYSEFLDYDSAFVDDLHALDELNSSENQDGVPYEPEIEEIPDLYYGGSECSGSCQTLNESLLALKSRVASLEEE